MRRTSCLATLAALALFVPDSPAQGVLLPGPYGAVYSRGGTLVRARVRVQLRLGLLSAYGLGPARPLAWLPPAGPVRVYAFYGLPPVTVNGGLLPGGPPRMPPAEDETPAAPGPEALPPPRADPPPPERPRPPAPRLPPPREERPAPPPPPPKEPPRKEPPKPAPPKVKDAEPDFPRPAGPADDPGEEYARLLGRGEEAFGDLEYGRAAQRFRQAVRLRPAEARAHFLLAQALLAQGKYHAAHDAILAGLERDPAWPARPFRPLALYGDAVAEYPAQLAALRATRARHPDDPVLLFLWAYQLWFDGRKDEAVGVFRRALAAGAGREGVEKFLRTLPPEEL